MYVLQSQLESLNLQGKSVATLIQSVNWPMVAAADYPAEETQAYVVTLQSQDRSLETFIYLHLKESNRAVIYRAEYAPFMGDRLEEAEQEALDFVESMGFMMDNLRFTKIQEAERQTFRQIIPIFYAALRDYEPILKARREQEKQEQAPEEVLPEPESPGLDPQAGAGAGQGMAPAELEEIVEVEEISESVTFAPPPAPSKPAPKPTPKIDEPIRTPVLSAPPSLEVREPDEELQAFFEPQGQVSEEPPPVAVEETSDLINIEVDVSPPPLEEVKAARPAVPAPPPSADDLAALAEMEKSLAREDEKEEETKDEMPDESAGMTLAEPQAQAILRLLLTL